MIFSEPYWVTWKADRENWSVQNIIVIVSRIAIVESNLSWIINDCIRWWVDDFVIEIRALTHNTRREGLRGCRSFN